MRLLRPLSSFPATGALAPSRTATAGPPSKRSSLAARRCRTIGLPMLCCFVSGMASLAFASEPPAAKNATTTARAVTRVFFQVPGQSTLMWADLLAQQPLAFSPAQPVAGFPPLDPARQSLVQMSASAGKIMVGVRDDEDGEFQSGWVLIDSGVQERAAGHRQSA